MMTTGVPECSQSDSLLHDDTAAAAAASADTPSLPGLGAHVQVAVYENAREAYFTSHLYEQRQPVVLRGLDIGECCQKWTPEYLCGVGGARQVKLHVSPSACMDFIHKNFAYRSLPFNKFVCRARKDINEEYFFQEDEKYYLRSIGSDARRDVADIHQQFPELACDVRFPKLFDESKFFSSVFRIASRGVQLWTHYDVMDNMLLQVAGSKRVLLFPPSDAHNLYLNGDKSEVLDIDCPDLQKYPKFKKVTRWECILQKGDVLFIPALWFHNVTTLDFGIAVNVFWRHLDASCYDSKDTYGNKDLVLGTRSLQIVEHAIRVLQELPPDYRHFYARRLVATIERKTYKHTHSCQHNDKPNT